MIAAEEVDDVIFLGAHFVPSAPDDHVRLECIPMLAADVPHLRWVDVFYERAFDEEESHEVLLAARRRTEPAGSRQPARPGPGPGPGVRLAVELGHQC